MSAAALTMPLSARQDQAAGEMLRANRHASAPPVDPEYRQENSAVTIDKTQRKIQGAEGKRGSVPDDGDMIAAIQEAAAADPRSHKELARACGVVPRTIQNVRDGLGLPNARTPMALARAVPEVKALVALWIDAEANHDPEQDRLLLEVLRAAQGALDRRQKRIVQEGPP